MTLPRAAQRELDALRTIAASVVAEARGAADHAEVRVDRGRRLEVQAQDGAPALISEAQSAGLALRVVRGGRVGTVTSSDLRGEGLQAALARALELAALGEEDPLAGPPEARLLARAWPELELYDGAAARVSPDRALGLALLAERAALAGERVVASGGAACSRVVQHSVLATSGGFVGGAASTWIGLRAHAIASAAGERRSGHYWSGGRHLVQVEAPERVGREAGRRAARMLGAGPIATGAYPTVFGPDAGAALVGMFAGCLLGDAVARGRSYLARRLGSQVASPRVSLVDDPHVLRGAASRGFDGEGLPTRRLAVVRRGILRAFLLDARSARRLDLPPTGAGGGGGGLVHASPSNFYMLAGRASPTALIRGVRRGLYVHALMGHGFDPSSGELSRGAEGFAIEDGALARPVAGVTVSRNLDELLRGVDGVARDLALRGAAAAPTFRVDWVTVAGT